MYRLAKCIDRILNAALVLFMAALVANVLWQVATRYLLNDPSSVTEEIAQFLLLWIGLLGGCYAYRRGSHLGLDLLTAKLSRSGQAFIRSFTTLATILFAVVVMIYGGGKLVWLTLELRQTSAALGVPMGYIYGALPLSGGLIVFYSVALWRDHTISH